MAAGLAMFDIQTPSGKNQGRICWEEWQLLYVMAEKSLGFQVCKPFPGLRGKI